MGPRHTLHPSPPRPRAVSLCPSSLLVTAPALDLQQWARLCPPFFNASVASRTPARKELGLGRWEGGVQTAAPQAMLGRLPSALSPPQRSGLLSDWTEGHRDGCVSRFPGCRQGDQCPPWAACPLSQARRGSEGHRAERGLGRVPGGPGRGRPCPLSLGVGEGSQAGGPGCASPPLCISHPPPGLGAPQPRAPPPGPAASLMDGGPAGGGRPGNRTVPMATRRPGKRGWGLHRISHPQPGAPGLRGFSLAPGAAGVRGCAGPRSGARRRPMLLIPLQYRGLKPGPAH